MNSFELKLISLEKSIIIKLEAAHAIDQKVIELLRNFSFQTNEAEKLISIEPLQKNTSELRENVAGFIESYKQSVPQVNKLNSFVNNLKDGEYFYIFQNVKLEKIQLIELGNRLQALNQGLDQKTVQDKFSLIFEDLLNNYDPLSFNGKNRMNIGNSDKSIVSCRFCGNTSSDVPFKKKAHAISEALGNKGLVCNEECDNCNAKFGDGIETDLIAFLSPYRAFFGIKGKGSGPPQLKGKNFSIKKTETGEVNFNVTCEGVNFPTRVEAPLHEKISLQNIYRALCKYVLSVLPNKYLSSFTNCVNWINNEVSFETLPPIYMKMIDKFYSEYPGLLVYIRKNIDQNLPYVVGEFKFAHIVIVFVVPCSDKDTLDFVDESELDKFWEISHYSKYAPRSDWTKIRLDSNEKKEFRFNFVFEQRI